MFKNYKNMAISRYFLLSIFVICLVCTSIGFSVENSYAVDIDDNSTDVGIELDIQDKLENSQIGNDVLEASSDDDDEVLGATHTINGGSFQTIQDKINSANSGDTIQLSGTFTASSGLKKITINKKLTITSTSQATLDGKKSSSIFFFNDNAKGTVISNLKFINGLNTEGGAIMIWANDVTIDNCVFEDNHATNVGGAVSSRYDATYGVNAVVKNCKFKNNDAEVAGGALTLYGDNSQVINCDFESNFVSNPEKCVYGGAIQLSMDTVPCTAYVINSRFVNNYAKPNAINSHGGAGCVRDGVSYIGCTFIGNSASEGGALTFHASGTIKDCIFIDNKGLAFGGALSTGFLYDTMNLDIINCVFDGNNAPLAGAAQLKGQNINIENSNFTDNYATTNGGAINVDATKVEISDSIFKNNNVGVNGGAIYINGKSTVIQDSVFDSNEAMPDYDNLDDGLGGAIYVNSANARISDNEFKYNTARNGSAVYYDKEGTNLRLSNNVMDENQAWVYSLPISAKDIYYGDREDISVVIHGGNNIARYNNLAVSNAIYNAANNNYINVDGFNPIDGATNTGELYQDDREYNIDILVTVYYQDSSVVYNNTLKSSYLGEVALKLNNLQPGYYYVSARHFEDTYYKEITNTTSFRVYPKIDNQIIISSDKDVYNYEDIAVWTIDITNNGPNNATGVFVNELLPDGLIYLRDTSNGLYNPKTGILNISTLDAGEKLSFDISTIINKTGNILNDVNITANELDTDLNNNHDDKLIKVNPACDISVVKSVNNSNPNYGDLVNWTITVKNNGPDVAHNVVVQDNIPKSLTPVFISGNYNSKKGTWTIDSLGVNEQVVFYIVSRVDETGLSENVASVSGDEYDYDLSNNNDSEVIKVSPSSDLSIEKTVNASAVNYQDSVKWTLTIRNNGPDDATGVKITDVLPEGFIYVSSTMDYDDDVIEIGNLAVGQVLSVDIICQVDTTGNFTNFAEVEANEYDPDPANNRANVSIVVYPAADLEITKEVDEAEPQFGDLITWTIVVKNNGPDAAHEIKVSEVIPDSLIWIEDDSDGDYNPKTGIWLIDELDADEKTEINIVCRINRTGVFVNNVSVSAREFDYNLTNNQDNESIEVEPTADLSIQKTVDNSNPNYQDLVKWTIIVANNGPDKANNVQVIDVLPEGLVFVNATPSKGFFNLDDDLWWVCCLENGEVETLEIVCRVNKTGKITNFANVTADEFDPDTANNQANESIDVPPSVDIKVVHDVDKSSTYFGETIVWMITVTNNGPDDATEVELTDILPDSVIFEGYNTKSRGFAGDVWRIGDLKVGEVKYLNISCITNDLGQIVNDAKATSLEYDWNMSNNRDDAEVNVLPVADVSIEKSVSNENPNYGNTVTWTLKVTNNGPNDASDVKVTDSLPKGLKVIKSSDDSNYKDGIWYVGDLESNQTKQLTIQCKVTSTGSIKNSASVSCYEYDPNLTNNQAEKSISVAPAADLAITKVASKSKYKVGDVITYVIKVVNNGPNTAKNIKITEKLNDLLKLKSAKATKGKYNKATYEWTIDRLGSGKSAKLVIKVVAKANGKIKNKVKVTCDTYDPVLSNNKDSVTVKVTGKNPNKKSKSHKKGSGKNSNKKSKSHNGNSGRNAGHGRFSNYPNGLHNPYGWSGNMGKYPYYLDGAAGNPDGGLNNSGNGSDSLEMHQTANPVGILMISILGSMAFLGGRKSNKR